MLVIRLTKVGRKHDPAYRLIITESTHAARSGKYLELLGNYDAHSGSVEVKQDRVVHWLGKGAKVSPRAYRLLKEKKVSVSCDAIRK